MLQRVIVDGVEIKLTATWAKIEESAPTSIVLWKFCYVVHHEFLLTIGHITCEVNAQIYGPNKNWHLYPLTHRCWCVNICPKPTEHSNGAGAGVFTSSGFLVNSQNWENEATWRLRRYRSQKMFLSAVGGSIVLWRGQNRYWCIHTKKKMQNLTYFLNKPRTFRLIIFSWNKTQASCCIKQKIAIPKSRNP